MKNRGINKKVYTKPELEMVKVDHEISLVMMTNPPLDPDPEDVFGSTTVETGVSAPISTFKSTETSNPFGTSSPNYNN